MRSKPQIDQTQFDHAVTKAFQDAPRHGAFPVIDDLKRRRMMNDVLLRAASAKRLSAADFRNGQRRIRKVYVAAAAAVFLMAVGGWQLRQHALLSTDTAGGSQGTSYFGEVLQSRGKLYLGESPAALYAPIPVGEAIQTNDKDALLRLPTGIDWWMEKSSEGKIRSVDAKNLVVEVHGGESWFRVDPNRKGPAFAVVTKMGTIHITGTVFVVRSDPSEVTVTLLEGKVWISRNQSEKYWVKAGDEIFLRDGHQQHLTSLALQRFQQQRSRLDWGGEGMQADGRTEVGTLDMVPDIQESAGKRAPSVVKVGLEEELQRIHRDIQLARKNGRWGRVVVLYNRLIQLAPGSESEMVARVSLGDIYLTRLHRYQDALFHFEKYIRSGQKTLLPEATYGKCLALKSLSNPVVEEQCLQRFVRQFPGAFQLSDAKSRLEKLHNGTSQ